MGNTSGSQLGGGPVGSVNTASGGSPDAAFMADADWGIFDSGPVAPAAQNTGSTDMSFDAFAGFSTSVSGNSGGDVLSQALSGVGMTTLAAPKLAPAPGSSFEADFGNFAGSAFTGPTTPATTHSMEGTSVSASKKKSYSEKVDKFLARLPKLSHLYSPTLLAT